MTPREFQTWLGKFCVAFPSCAAWIANMPTEKDGSEASTFRPAQAQVLAEWSKTLMPCVYGDAVEAIRKIHDGSLDRPATWDEWPTAIARHCRREQAQRVTTKITFRERTYHCPRCRDVGLRFGVHPKCFAEACRNAEMFLNEGVVTGCGYACECRSGERYRDRAILFDDWLIDTNTPEWIRMSNVEQRQVVIDRAQEVRHLLCGARPVAVYQS